MSSQWLTNPHIFVEKYYNDVKMCAIASTITGLTIVYSTVYSGADQRKHQSSVSLVFLWGSHRWPVNSPDKGPVTWKMFPFDNVIMMVLLLSIIKTRCFLQLIMLHRAMCDFFKLKFTCFNPMFLMLWSPQLPTTRRRWTITFHSWTLIDLREIWMIFFLSIVVKLNLMVFIWGVSGKLALDESL